MLVVASTGVGKSTSVIQNIHILTPPGPATSPDKWLSTQLYAFVFDVCPCTVILTTNLGGLQVCLTWS